MARLAANPACAAADAAGPVNVAAFTTARTVALSATSALSATFSLSLTFALALTGAFALACALLALPGLGHFLATLAKLARGGCGLLRCRLLLGALLQVACGVAQGVLRGRDVALL